MAFLKVALSGLALTVILGARCGYSQSNVAIITIIYVVFGTLQEILFSQDLRVLSGKKEDSCQHLAPYGGFFFFPLKPSV